MSGEHGPRHRLTDPTPPSFSEHVGLTARQALAARRQAERHESTRAFELAVEHWTLALVIEPHTPAAWRGLARALRALARTDQATTVDRAAAIVGRSLP